MPWRASRTANLCSLYADIRFPPTRYPIDVQREFTAAVQKIAKQKLKRPVEVEFYMSRGGTLIAENHVAIKAIGDAHHGTTGEHVRAKFSPPFCTDAIDANRLGIPTVVYGSGGDNRQSAEDKGRPAGQGGGVRVH